MSEGKECPACRRRIAQWCPAIRQVLPDRRDRSPPAAEAARTLAPERKPPVRRRCAHTDDAGHRPAEMKRTSRCQPVHHHGLQAPTRFSLTPPTGEITGPRTCDPPAANGAAHSCASAPQVGDAALTVPAEAQPAHGTCREGWRRGDGRSSACRGLYSTPRGNTMDSAADGVFRRHRSFRALPNAC